MTTEQELAMFASAGQLFSVVLRHPGFYALKRSQAGVFSVGVRVSPLATSPQWFEHRNALEALALAARAIEQHGKIVGPS